MSTELTEIASIPPDIQAHLQEPSGQRLEHYPRLKSSKVLAKLIAGFAHSDESGTIIVGYDAQEKKIVGVKNRARLEKLLEHAVILLGRTSLVQKVEFYKSHEGKVIGVIRVPAVDILIVSPGGKAIVRVGATFQQMENDEIVKRATKRRLRMEDLGGVIVRQGDEIARLRNAADKQAHDLAEAKKEVSEANAKLTAAHSWFGRFMWALIGSAATFIGNIAWPYLHQFVMSFLP